MSNNQLNTLAQVLCIIGLWVCVFIIWFSTGVIK
jgi:hypothetical protein